MSTGSPIIYLALSSNVSFLGGNRGETLADLEGGWWNEQKTPTDTDKTLEGSPRDLFLFQRLHAVDRIVCLGGIS